MKRNILAVLLVGVSSEAFATTQTMDPSMMMRMMQFMHAHPEAASQMMQVANQQIDEDSTTENYGIHTAQPLIVTANSDNLQAEYRDGGAQVRELNLENYDFSNSKNLKDVVNFFKKNELRNLKTIDIRGAKKVGAFFESVFTTECTTSLYSLEWIKASNATELETKHIEGTLFKYIESYHGCTRDMRKWSDRHGDIIAAFIRIDVEGVNTFKDSPLWKGIRTKLLEVSYRGREEPDMAPVIIRTQG